MPGDDIKQVNDVVKRVGLTKGQRKLLHREAAKLKFKGGQLAFEELLQLAKSVKARYPGK